MGNVLFQLLKYPMKMIKNPVLNRMALEKSFLKL